MHRWSWWRSDVDAWSFRGMIPSWTAQDNDRKNNIKNIIWSNQQSTDWDLPIKQQRARELSESGRIATKQTAHLRVVGLQQTLPRNNWPNMRTSTSTVRGLDQGLEVWNRPKASSRPRTSWRFRKFKRLI